MLHSPGGKALSGAYICRSGGPKPRDRQRSGSMFNVGLHIALISSHSDLIASTYDHIASPDSVELFSANVCLYIYIYILFSLYFSLYLSISFYFIAFYYFISLLELLESFWAPFARIHKDLRLFCPRSGPPLSTSSL